MDWPSGFVLGSNGEKTENTFATSASAGVYSAFQTIVTTAKPVQQIEVTGGVGADNTSAQTLVTINIATGGAGSEVIIGYAKALVAPLAATGNTAFFYFSKLQYFPAGTRFSIRAASSAAGIVNVYYGANLTEQ